MAKRNFIGRPINAFEAARRARKERRRQEVLDRPSKITVGEVKITKTPKKRKILRRSKLA